MNEAFKKELKRNADISFEYHKSSDLYKVSGEKIIISDKNFVVLAEVEGYCMDASNL